ncbi:phytanoyl-CoA dioxygenase family protein [Sphingomonas sp. MG17]|jgi:ectoine hydroxylase|uniref:Phytanoyl-CoA dioxygenase family protein n=1 Tax=Sphingomonas tagetis TaxID=2949092 RepID=A0A9X2HRI8_9SPHN|nr:phytanoyl-CoA dioxygenase family protein [Sphingomonas tagetis]MCP3730560.1 phytanoyl-CoA dioxygenase family protein [Sphingomonas tagetis]
MKLSQDRLNEFQENGYLVIPDLFSAEEIAEIRSAMDRVFEQDDPANIREKKSGSVRTAMGLHLRDALFAKLVRHPRLIEPAQQIAGDELYVQQVKINVKVAFEGEQWQWHQDFSTHHHDDGVPEPLALNLHIFLDDVTQFNGPLYFFRGSQRFGSVATRHDTETTSYALWVVEQDKVREIAEGCELVAATGKAGTALIFGDCLVHGSPPNMSPWNRAIFSLIVNPVANAYTQVTRKDHHHHRDLTPIEPLADDCLAAQPAA